MDDLINTCMLKGKLTPATKDAMRAFALKDRKSFDELMLKTPDFSVVPLQNSPAGDHQGAGSVSEMDMMVAKNLGVDPEKLKATAAAMAK